VESSPCRKGTGGSTWMREGAFLERLSTILLGVRLRCNYCFWGQRRGQELRSRWRGLRQSGRMAFTNYLMQSVIFGWVSMGWARPVWQACVTAALAIGRVLHITDRLQRLNWLQHFPMAGGMVGAQRDVWNTTAAMACVKDIHSPIDDGEARFGPASEWARGQKKRQASINGTVQPERSK